MSWINEQIAVSGAFNDRDIPRLEEQGVRAVLDIRSERADNEELLKKHGMDYLRVKVDDTFSPSFDQLEMIMNFIGPLLDKGRKVLIHCQNGAGRSPVVVVAVLARRGMNVSDALELVGGKHANCGLTENQLHFLNHKLSTFLKTEKRINTLIQTDGDRPMRKKLYVVNTNPFRGRGYDVWKRFRALWPEEVRPEDIIMTRWSGHARKIAAESRDYDIIVSIGGDGTASDILSGIMDRLEPRPALAVMPGGSTNIMANNLGIGSIEDAITSLRDEHMRPFDIMRIDCMVNGRPAHKYSFMACNVGFAAVSYRMLGPWMERVFGLTKARYLRSIVGTIVYRPTQITVLCDGHEYSGYTKEVLIGNAEWILQNGLRVAPMTNVDEGELNVTIIPAQTKTRDFYNISKVATGGNIREKGVLYFLTKKSKIKSDPQAGLVIDGEFFGTTPATITLCPGAVWVVLPKG